MKSNLQIISGKYRGKKLNLPSEARPTQNLARGALFNMLNEILNATKDFVVWDVFAGSGAVGLEFLSRYNNANIVFTDNANNSIETVKKNVKSINCDAIIEKTDAIAAIEKFAKSTDVFFIDPPYAEFELGAFFVKKITNLAKSGAIVIWEFENNQNVPKISDKWQILKDKTYGRAHFIILQKQ